MNILAIDQSLVNSGIAIYKDNNLIVDSIKIKDRGIQRLVNIQIMFETLLVENKIDILCMEDYAFSAKGQVFSLGELGAAIKLVWYKLQLSKPLFLLTVPIGTHKKFSTGKGNTKKDLMLKEVYKRYQIDVSDDNQADAVSILKTFIAYCDRLTHRGIKPTLVQSQALNALDDIVRKDILLYNFIRDNYVG